MKLLRKSTMLFLLTVIMLNVLYILDMPCVRAATVDTDLETPIISSISNTVDGIKVSWGEVNKAVKYRLFYRISGGKWNKLADTMDTEYIWNQAESGTTYIFTVRCLSYDENYYTSGFNSTGKTITYIAAPVVSSVHGMVNGIKVTWEAVNGASQYRLFYKNPGGKWTTVIDTDETSYVWNEAESGKTYTFVVRAVNSTGTAYTSALNTKGKTIIYIKPPTVSKVENTTDGVKISWNRVNGAEIYRLFYKIDGGKWNQIIDTYEDSYIWKEAESGVRYTFVVRAINVAGSYISALNPSGKTITFIQAPQIYDVYQSKNSIYIMWEDINGAEKYRLFFRFNGSGIWNRIVDTASTHLTLPRNWAIRGTTYIFAVRAINAAGTAYTSAVYLDGYTFTVE